MTIFLIVSIVLFTAAIICVVLYVLHRIGYIYIDQFFYYRCWKYLVGGLICLILSVLCFIEYIHKVQNNAIMHYISGDYELVEEMINDQVVNSYYRLIQIDYD